MENNYEVCPGCGAIWTDEEFEDGECDCCGYHMGDELDYDSSEDD